MKDKLTNQEAKKFFDDRKQKLRFGSKNTDKEKDTYILVYKSGSEQVMTEIHYNKILSKRKNDPFWSEVIYSYKLPELRDGQAALKTYTYKRTKSVAARMVSAMQKVMEDIDNQELKGNREETSRNYSTLSNEPDLQKSIISNNSDLFSKQLYKFSAPE